MTGVSGEIRWVAARWTSSGSPPGSAGNSWRRAQVSARELTRAYLDRIAAVDGQVKSFLLVDEDGAHGGRGGGGRQALRRAASLGGRADSAQGHLRGRGHGDHLRLQDPQGLHPSLRRHHHRQAAGRGPHLPGQAQHGRVRHGQLHRELRLPDHPEPLGPRPGAGRLQWRLRRLRRRLGGPLGPGHRHRWLHPSAGLAVRRGGAQAHLRRGQPLRPGGLRQLAGPDRPAHPRRQGQRGPPGPHRRPRSARLHQPGADGAGGSAGPERPGGAALRRDQGVHRRRHRAGRAGSVRLRGGRHRRPGRGLRRGEPAQRGAGHRRLLPHRPLGGQRQPGPLRRGPLRPPDGRTPKTSTRCTPGPAAKASAPRSSGAS